MFTYYAGTYLKIIGEIAIIIDTAEKANGLKIYSLFLWKAIELTISSLTLSLKLAQAVKMMEIQSYNLKLCLEKSKGSVE